MEVRNYVNQKSFTSRCKDALERIEGLVDMVDDIKKTIDMVPEVNTDEGLKEAYSELKKAVTFCIDKEQETIMKEVQR